MSLKNPPTSTPTIPTLSRENHAALFSVINKARLLNGWMTRTAQELDATIRTWSEMFARYAIPIAAYGELYARAFDVRQERMRQGGDVPQMDATLLVSQWTGSFGLQALLKQREVEAGRTLGANAESVCRHCDGTGYRTEFEGGYSVARRCDHSEGTGDEV